MIKQITKLEACAWLDAINERYKSNIRVSEWPNTLFFRRDSLIIEIAAVKDIVADIFVIGRCKDNPIIDIISLLIYYYPPFRAVMWHSNKSHSKYDWIINNLKGRKFIDEADERKRIYYEVKYYDGIEEDLRNLQKRERDRNAKKENN